MPARHAKWAVCRKQQRAARRLPLYRLLSAAAIASAIGLTALAALALYVVPHADDLCFGAAWQEHRLAGAVRHYYETHSGRLAANTLIAAPFAIAAATAIDLTSLYSLASGIIFAVFGVFALWLARRLWPALPARATIAMATILLVALLANARSIRDLLYWLPGIANYTVPGLTVAILIVVLHAALCRREPVSSTTAAMMAPFLLWAALSHELAGGLVVIVLAVSVVVRLQAAAVPPQLKLHALLALPALIGFALVYGAPGSQARTTLYPGHGDLPVSLLWGVLLQVEFVFRRMAYPGTLGWLLLAFLLSQVYVLRFGRPPRLTPLQVWYPVGLFLIAGFFVFAAGYYGQGSPIPARVQNLVYLIGFVSLTATAVAAAQCHGAQVRRWVRRRFPAVSFRRAFLFAGIVLLAGSPGLYHAPLALDGAAALRTDNDTRFALLADAEPGEQATVPAFEAVPSLLLIEDLRADPEFLINRCYADFFGLAAISAGGPTTD